jgi:glycerophosphoryl diester phosphodiesterase
VVVRHDYALSRDIARDASGAWIEDSNRPLLRDLSLAAIRTHDVGRLRPGADYTARYPEQQPADGERIPTVDEVITRFLAECAPPTRLVVELKTDPTRPHLSWHPDTLTDRTIAVLRARGVLDRTQVIAFDWRPLRRVHTIAPEVPTSFLTVESRDLNSIERGAPGASPWMDGLDVDDHGGSVPRAIVAAGGRHWTPNFRNLTPALLAEAHALGLQVYPWTVNAEDDLSAMLAMGVHGITTDRPDRLRDVLRARASEGPRLR